MVSYKNKNSESRSQNSEERLNAGHVHQMINERTALLTLKTVTPILPTDLHFILLSQVDSLSCTKVPSNFSLIPEVTRRLDPTWRSIFPSPTPLLSMGMKPPGVFICVDIFCTQEYLSTIKAAWCGTNIFIYR
jgi:hypothetical protein